MAGAAPLAGTDLVVVPTAGPPLRCLCTLEYSSKDNEGVEEHVSISRGPGMPPPTWDDLVLVRALAWPDDVRVYQYLPALEGDSAEPWLNVPGVEVLHLRHYRRGPRPAELDASRSHDR